MCVSCSEEEDLREGNLGFLKYFYNFNFFHGCISYTVVVHGLFLFLAGKTFLILLRLEMNDTEKNS